LKPIKPKDVAMLSPERVRIAKILKTHIDRAVEELGEGCDVMLQGRYAKTPIHLEIEVSSKEQIPWLKPRVMQKLAEKYPAEANRI
jgi:hypothetical protein